jgi:hypothetical protein
LRKEDILVYYVAYHQDKRITTSPEENGQVAELQRNGGTPYQSTRPSTGRQCDDNDDDDDDDHNDDDDDIL